MTELERTLRDVARDMQHPPTPNMADAVGRRLRAARPRQPLRTRRFVIALAVVLLLPAGAVAAVPSARDAVLEALGIKGVTIQRTRELVPLSPGRPLDLGQRVATASAANRVTFQVVAPRPRARSTRRGLLPAVPARRGALARLPRASRRPALPLHAPGVGADPVPGHGRIPLCRQVRRCRHVLRNPQGSRRARRPACRATAPVRLSRCARTYPDREPQARRQHPAVAARAAHASP